MKGCDILTNEEFLKSKTGVQFIEYLTKILTQPFSKYVDWESWLKSEERKFIYKGKDGEYRRGCDDDIRWLPCRIIEKDTKFGNPYYVVLDFSDEKPQVMSVPACYIRDVEVKQEEEPEPEDIELPF